jgi:phosphoglycolate phosphatase-like HAD superfamily hydrolase
VLLLFDIDGTLLRGAADAHAEAMHVALARVYGIDDVRTQSGDRAGRTDGEIARLILRDRGVPEADIDAGVADLRDATCREYERLAPADLSATVAAGMPELLAVLRPRDDLIVSLLTGNFEPIARLKLARAGIGEHFAAGQGAFGSDDESRAALPDVARRRAAVNGSPYPRERTLIIGDTPRDIACARAGGVRVAAVATGPHPVDELSDADVVASDAFELREHLEPLLGR